MFFVKGTRVRELTPRLTHKISQTLTKRCDIRNLFLFLGIEENKIDTVFQNNKDEIEGAVYQLMIEWRKRQRTRAETYDTLWKALTDEEVNLSSITYEVLKVLPAEVIQEKPILLNASNERVNDELNEKVRTEHFIY